MSDGRTHFIANIAAGSAMTLLAAWYAPAAVAPVAVGATIATFVTPDADIDHTTHPEDVLRRIPVVGYAFQVIWFPYALAMPHRGTSHHWLFGTAGRVGYTALLTLFAVWLAQHVGLSLDALREIAERWTWAHVALLVGAWWVQDMTHLALDKV